MINLLPSIQKKELQEEERWKMVMILGILVFGFLICLTLILFAIKIYISGQVEVQKILVRAQKRELEWVISRELKEKIKLTNQNLLKLNSFYQVQPNLTELLEKISHTMLPKTYLTNLSLSPVKKKKYGISLTGYALNRKILFELKNNFEKEKRFQDIYIPPANWVKPTDINFSLRFKVK